MIEYTVDIEMQAPDGDLAELVIALDGELERSGLIGPASAGNVAEHTVSVITQVKASNTTKAIGLVTKVVARALGYGASDAEEKEIRVACEPYEAQELRELVSRAEIARRLDLSGVRVHQLAQRVDFPKPVQRFGNHNLLYRWGEILAWNNHRKKYAKPGRPKFSRPRYSA